MELPGTALDTIPNLSGSRGCALSTDEVVNPCLESREGALDVGTLAETGAEEAAVDDQQDPASTLEQDRRHKETDPQRNLKARDNRHGRVIVLLDESANGVGERVRGVLGSPAGRGGTLGGRGDSRNDSGACVGRKVEDRIDKVREHGDRVLGGEEPDQGHHYKGVYKSVECDKERPPRTRSQILRRGVG